MAKRRTIIGIAALGAALLASVPALAENWAQFAEGENGVVFWLDRDSVRQVGDYRQAWTKSDYSAVAEGDISARKALEDYDCAGGRLRTRGTVAYGRDGNILRMINLTEAESEWVAVKEGSIADSKIRTVCAIPL